MDVAVSIPFTVGGPGGAMLVLITPLPLVLHLSSMPILYPHLLLFYSLMIILLKQQNDLVSFLVLYLQALVQLLSRMVYLLVLSNIDTATLRITSPTSGNEGSTVNNIQFTVTLDNAVSSGFTVYFSVTDGSAVLNSDYQPPGSNSLTFAGNAGEQQSVSVGVIGDTVVEADEFFVFTLTSVTTPLSVSFDATNPTQYRIINDDQSQITLSPASVSVTEPDSGTTSTFITITSSNAVDIPFTISYATTGITATSGADYVQQSNSLTFAGNALESKTIELVIIGDAMVESDETFTLTIGSVTPNSRAIIITGPTTSTVTIVDQDYAVITISDGSIAETQGFLAFVVSLEGQVQSGFQVDVITADASALAGSDYTALSSTLTFNGVANERQTVYVAITNDNLC